MLLDEGARRFGFSARGLRCGEEGVRVGPVALLELDVSGAWTPRPEEALTRELSAAYGFPVGLETKTAGLRSVAKALNDGDLSLAQIATLLLQMPDPPRRIDTRSRAPDRVALADALAASRLLKVDADWEEQHPRTGTAPNPGWFATKPKDADEAQPRGGENTSESRPSAEPTAYNSYFHDALRDKLLQDYNKNGNKCYKEVNISFGAVAARLDLLCRRADGELAGVEVKTGDTEYTDAQKTVYPHAILGIGVTSRDQRISNLDLTPGSVLPPFDIELAYSSGPGADVKIFSLRMLMLMGIR